MLNKSKIILGPFVLLVTALFSACGDVQPTQTATLPVPAAQIPTLVVTTFSETATSIPVVPAQTVTTIIPVNKENFLLYVSAGNIHLRKPDGQDITITSLGKDNLPSWSPDGLHFVFFRSSEDSSANNLFVGNSNGINVHAIAHTEAQYGWTYDNKLLYAEKLPTTKQNPFPSPITNPRGGSPGNPLQVVSLDLVTAAKKTEGYINEHTGCGGGESPELDEAAGISSYQTPTYFKLKDDHLFVKVNCSGTVKVITPNENAVDGNITLKQERKSFFAGVKPSFDYNQAVGLQYSPGENFPHTIAFFAEGGPTPWVLDLKRTIETVAWSPDNQWVYFSSPKQGSLQPQTTLWRVRFDGTSLTQLLASDLLDIPALTVASDYSVVYAGVDNEDPTTSKHAVIYHLDSAGKNQLMLPIAGQPSYNSLVSQKTH